MMMVVVVIVVALVEACLRLAEVIYAPFYALLEFEAISDRTPQALRAYS